jgi:chaperonin GroEL
MKLKDVKLENLGSATKIESYKNKTTIAGGKGDWEQIEERIETYKEELNQTESMHECERIQERITKLASGIAVIRVGAATEIEMIEKKHRIEDALEAVKSAQAEGILPGGGVALYRASETIGRSDLEGDELLGFNIIKDIATEPIRQLAKNSGVSADIILEKVKNSQEEEGYNFANHTIIDMYDNGIIDPLRVTKTALLNAVSVASTLLTTNYAIIEE